jgi:Ca2+-binding RTX toxin-like protein
MAVLNVNEGTFRADLFKIGRLLNYEDVVTTSTQIDFYFNDGTVIRRLTGNSFAADGDGAPALGTVTSLTEIRDGSPQFTLSGFAMSWTAFKEFSLANDTGGFLSQVFSGNDSLTGNGRKDVMIGFDGADSITGGGGNDKIIGKDGADVLDGGAGGDLLIGGLGDDTYILDDRGDRVTEKADEGFDCIESSLSHRWARTSKNSSSPAPMTSREPATAWTT